MLETIRLTIFQRIENAASVRPITRRALQFVLWWVDNGQRVVQGALAVMFVWMGWVFGLPESAFQTTHTFDWMAEHASEAVWGQICNTLGMFGLWAAFSVKRFIRGSSAFFTALLCGTLAWGFYRSNPNGIGYIPFTVMTALSYWLLLARLVDNVKRH